MFVLLLAKQFPGVCFHINGKKQYTKAFEQITNIRIHNDSDCSDKMNSILRHISKKDFRFLFRARRCVLAIYIGGSLYIQPPKKNRTGYYLNNRNMRLPQKPFFVIGANFGPYTDEEFIHFFRREFKEYTGVSFRDQKSLELFPESDNTQAAPDILFGIKTAYGELQKKKTVCAEKGDIVFSMIGKNSVQNAPVYIAHMSGLAQQYINAGYQVKLLSLCEYQGDLDACRQVKQKISGEAEIVNYDGCPETVIACIANAKYLVGSRFHAIVSALAFQVPVLPVVYSSKTTDMLKEIGYRGAWLDINETERISFAFAEECRRKKITVDSDRLSQMSKKHFDLLRPFCS